MVSLANLLGEFKRWLDGDEAEALEKEQPAVRREWEDFLIAVAREIEAVMQREMFTPPGGPTYIPPEYLVFLSREDDAQWQGSKREGLERGLNYVLAQRVQELLGNDEVQTRSFAVELRVDGALEKGKFRVQPVWDTSSPKTEVRPRRKEGAPPTPVSSVEADGSEATIVRPRAPLFTLTLTQPGGEAELRNFHHAVVTIGRGSKDFPVDVQLEGDLEISRKQAIIERLEDKSFTVSCEGRNPIEVDGLEVQQGEKVEVRPGQVIKIGPYLLTVPGEREEAARQVEPSAAVPAADESGVVG